jgi:hypothetical protein
VLRIRIGGFEWLDQNPYGMNIQNAIPDEGVEIAPRQIKTSAGYGSLLNTKKFPNRFNFLIYT